MHFHDSGPVIVEIKGFPNTTSGTVSGKATLTAQQANDLAAGKIYSQIHSETKARKKTAANAHSVTFRNDNTGFRNMKIVSISQAPVDNLFRINFRRL